MTQCADFLGTLLSSEVEERVADEEETYLEAPPDPEPVLPRAMQDPELLEVDAALRPRHEIIAEEMDHARRHNHPLALALVYLNRAEAISNQGNDAVTEAEDMLAERLKDSTPGHRVERFGELMFGVFPHEEGEQVEAWALQLQNELDQETGLIEGGASIGIAVMQERHTTGDDLRNDATAALQAAYETGACTILE
jgi:GGDEF domain-containing protein